MKKTLHEYLSDLEEKEITNLYNELPKELKLRKKQVCKSEMIDNIAIKIILDFTAHIIFLTDEENKQLDAIAKGIQPKKINPRLVDSLFVLKEGNNYYLPEEIQDIYNHSKDQKIIKGKNSFPFKFYLKVNGVLEINNLLELMKETGTTITKQQALEYAKEYDFIVKNNLIYLDELALELDEKEDLHNKKQERPFKVFCLEEMLATDLSETQENYESKIKKILSKTIKKKKVLEDYTNIIYNMVSVGFNYKEKIKKALEVGEINLPSKDLKKLFDLADDIYWYYPSWELNGHSEADFEDEYIDYDEKDDIFYLELLPKETQIEAYLTVYLAINGAISISTLIEILEKEHNLKTKKADLIKVAKKAECFIINGDYIQIEGVPQELINEILHVKNNLGKYKIIDDINMIMKEMDQISENLEEICDNYGLTNEDAWKIENMAKFGCITKELLESSLKDEGIKIASNKIKSFVKEILPIIKNTRIWSLNGYKMSELNQQIKASKIGRNDLCPCGSGKKYKKCCGK